MNEVIIVLFLIFAVLPVMVLLAYLAQETYEITKLSIRRGLTLKGWFDLMRKGRVHG